MGEDGQIEIKCPYTFREHVRALEANEVPEDHLAQIQGQLFVTGRAWCDFISYHPQFPESANLVIIRVPRDEEAIADMEQQLLAFAELVQSMVAKITGKED